MEKKFQLPSHDGHIIYGVKNSFKGNKKAIFIVHGLNCGPNEYIIKSAANYFVTRGYDVYRIDLYSGQENSIKMVDTTIANQAKDFEIMRAHFSRNYEASFAIGHSYGGTTLVMANSENIRASSLWDPTYDHKKILIGLFGECFEKLPDGRYIIERGRGYIVGESLYKEANSLDVLVCKKLAEDYNTPCQVVLAGDGVYVKEPASFDTYSNNKHARHVIKGADHFFYNDGNCEELLEKTHKWFESFNNA